MDASGAGTGEVGPGAAWSWGARMRIDSSAIDFGSTHLKSEQATRQERLRQWVGDRRPDFERLERGVSEGQRARAEVGDDGDRRSLLARRVAGIARRLEADAARQARSAPRPESADAPAKPDDEDPTNGDPKLLRIKLIVEALTGRKVKVLSTHDLEAAKENGEAAAAQVQQAAQQPQRVGWGVEYDLHETYDEVEQTTFSAQGVIKTADGQAIAFDFEMEMSRSYHEENHVSVRAGDAVLKDPLVINFGGTAAQLTDETFSFDLDADGTKDQMAWVASGSGFLALDKDGNGAIDDGSELFGAKTGDGFAELAAYDDDKNGWIDEADAVYDRLQVWSKSGGDDVVASLQERNVGAIYLGQQATPFEIKNAANELQGAVRASGIYVKEDGSGVGSVQQIDLAL